MYENIKRMTEVYDVDDANRLLSWGWKLLHVRDVKWGDFQKRGYLMGKTETGVAQCAIDEINRRTKETPHSPIPTDADEAEPKPYRTHRLGDLFSPTLSGERTSRNVTKTDMMNAIGASDMEIENKMHGYIPFTAPEAITIHDKFFPDVPIAALFGDKEQQRKALEESKPSAKCATDSAASERRRGRSLEELRVTATLD